MNKSLRQLILDNAKTILDVVALVVLFGLVTLFAVRYEAFDAFVGLVERNRQASLDVFATALLVLSGLLLVFALRRWLDLRLEVKRIKMEEELLRLTKAELEKIVKERTTELSRANEQLLKEISDRKLAQDQLEYRAFSDALTDLPNRALFLNRLVEMFEYKKRYQDFLFAVLFMDVDRFKVINDSLGHLIGDQLLIMIGQRLKSCVRATDTVARFGGDEFSIMLRDIKYRDDVHIVADRINKVMKEPFRIYGQEVYTAMSIGIAHCDMSYYDRPMEILRDADTAMYRAKESGGGCQVVFDSEMHARAVTVLEIETDLRKALERKEFTIHYQPLVRVSDERIVGLEALMRWEHPERGHILPGEFLHVAEETGIIISLGQWVLLEACGQMKKWQDEMPECRGMTVSVNVSGREFVQPGFADSVGEILSKTGLDASSLRLEITERVIVTNPEYASSLLNRLRDMGVQLDIDDFGTGHSTLSNIRDYPVNALKIDRSFISSLAADEQNTEIVRAIVTLARILNLEVIAEGVETEEQQSLSKEMQCGYIQGHYYYRAMDGDAARALLSQQSKA